MKKALYILAIAGWLTLQACDSEDNVKGIFIENDWKLSFLIYDAQRTSIAGKVYSLDFTEQTFTFTTPTGATITGQWKADGGTRSFQCNNVKVASGSIGGDTIVPKVKDILENAQRYEGNDIYLQIHSADNNYMQFYSKAL